jgi:hypothetical protein
MRSLDVPFEQINSEQPVKQIYNWASPIDSSEPPDSTVNLPSGQIQTFGVQSTAAAEPFAGRYLEG